MAEADKAKTIKIVIAVVLFAIAGYFAYASFSGGGGEPPVSAIDKLPEEKQQELERERERRERDAEQQVVGGA